MYYELMCQSGAEGFTLYDFGRSKNGRTAARSTSNPLGHAGRNLPYEMLLVKRKELPNLSPNNPKFSLAIQFWQRVPIPVARAIGPCLFAWSRS